MTDEQKLVAKLVLFLLAIIATELAIIGIWVVTYLPQAIG